MKLKCYNKKCLHSWSYDGKAKNDMDTLTCPKCLYKLRLGKSKGNTLPNALPSRLPIRLPNESSLYIGKITPEMFKDPPIKILRPKLPSSILKAMNKKEQEQNNPFLNPPKEEPDFEIKKVPYA